MSRLDTKSPAPNPDAPLLQLSNLEICLQGETNIDLERLILRIVINDGGGMYVTDI